ncbi:MAG: chaperonin GroEL [Candidatus Eisenbacteria bacterium]
MGKRIAFDDAAREALRRGVDQLAGAVRVTLGPRGRHVVIERAHAAPAITNDGVTVAREIELENPMEDMGARLLKEVAQKTADAAGDGTTTATVLAQALVGEGLRAVVAGHHPMALKRGIEKAVVAVTTDLVGRARAVSTRDDLLRVATVAARQDPRIGTLIADALERVGRQGAVTVEEGRSLDTVLEVVEGLRFDGGYLSPYFVNEPETMSVALEDPLLLVAELKASAVRDVVNALELAAAAKRPLVVIAEDVEGEALATMVVNRLRGTVTSVALKAPEIGTARSETLADLAVLTGATVLSRETGRTLESVTAGDLGRAKRVEVDHDSTVVLEGGGDNAVIRARIAAVELELADATHESDRARLRRRVGRLAGGVAVIHVGGATEPEMKERKSRIEDALAATRSAVEEGVVPGGGIALFLARSAVDGLALAGEEAVGAAIVRRALEEPLRRIAFNAGEDPAVAVERTGARGGTFGFDAVSGVYLDLEAAGVLDAVKVVRCALQNAASIATLVLTTDAVVVDEPGEPPPAAEA